MLVKITMFVVNIFKTHIAIIIPIIAAAIGFVSKTICEKGGVIGVLKKIYINRRKIEYEGKELLLKEVDYLTQAINTLKQELDTSTDKNFISKCKAKIEELDKKKKEILLKL